MNLSATRAEPASPVAGVGHVHLKVRDLDRAASFYADLLGWRETERVGGIAFLSAGVRHHDLALQARPDAAAAGRDRLGLYHVAFELPDLDTLRRSVDRLAAGGVAAHVVDHGISVAAYLDDPDGNGVELYVDRRDHPAGRRVWGTA